jgi:DNA-binding transcriptional MocR family regulator
VLWLDRKASEDAVVAAAAARGVGVYGIRQYFCATDPPPAIILGYSRLRPHDIREGVKRLADVVGM